jgi:hypothetical protein
MKTIYNYIVILFHIWMNMFCVISDCNEITGMYLMLEGLCIVAAK